MEPKKPAPNKVTPPPRARRSLLDNSAFVVVFSAICALLAWLLVTMFLDPQSSKTISDVPVTFNYQTATYTALGLDIVEQPENAKASVRVEGNGTVIGSITAASIMVYPNYSTVTGAGENILNLDARIVDSEYTNMDIKVTVEGPSTVTVIFDTVSEKTVTVTPDTSGVTISDGYTLRKTTAVPAEVTLRGPTSELDQIASVVAPVSSEETLSDTTTLPSVLEMRNEDGEVITPQYTTMDNETSNVTLTVYQVRELPLEVDFINTPVGFDTSSLKYSLSYDTLTVAGPAKTISALTKLSVTSFDLDKEFAFDRDYQRQIELPEGIVSQDGVSSVTLSFDTTGMSSTSLNVSNIRTINEPSNLDVQVLTSVINNIQLYGPEEEIAELSAENVLVQVDCQNLTSTTGQGQQTLPVTIQIPSSSRIFAVGSYTVECQITAQ